MSVAANQQTCASRAARGYHAGRPGIWALAVMGAILLTSPALAQISQSPAETGAPMPQPVGPPSPETSSASDTSATKPQVPADSSVAPPAATIGVLPDALSPWSMFLHADMIVKFVMCGLALASLATWTVWLAKGMELFGAKRRARSAIRKLERAANLTEATREIESAWTRRGPVADLIEAATRENHRSYDLSSEGVKERLSIALARVEARAGRAMARGTGLLATIGSTAPFVGLFGTVWGIMNAFIGISKSHTTNLAVVAPGIAEALLATAIGLVAAIPAVIIYNVFSRSITGYRAMLSDASGEILQHMSRDLERRDRELLSREQLTSGHNGILAKG